MMILTEERKPIFAEEIMAISHRDSCYIFDLFDDGLLVSSRAPMEQSPQSESLQRYVDPITWEEIRAHLLSYSSIPLVVDTKWGTGIVIPTLAPASSLGVLCVPSIPRDLLIRIAKVGLCGTFALASSTNDIRARQSKRTAACLPYFRDWMARVSESFDSLTLPKEQDPREPINDILRAHMLRLSRYVGIPVTISEQDSLYSYGDFDYPLFVAFILTVFCLGRRVATDRSVRVRLDMTAFGATVRVAMTKGENISSEQLQELVSLRALAERKNILFDYAEQGDMLCIRISPVSKDWSYLELKAPDLFEWETN